MKFIVLALMLMGCEDAASRRADVERGFVLACRAQCKDFAGFEIKYADDALLCQCVKYEEK